MRAASNGVEKTSVYYEPLGQHTECYCRNMYAYMYRCRWLLDNAMHGDQRAYIKPDVHLFCFRSTLSPLPLFTFAKVSYSSLLFFWSTDAKLIVLMIIPDEIWAVYGIVTEEKVNRAVRLQDKKKMAFKIY